MECDGLFTLSFEGPPLYGQHLIHQTFSTNSQHNTEEAMPVKLNSLIAAIVLSSIFPPLHAQQSPSVPEHDMHMHDQMNMQPIEPVYPRLGRTQEQSHDKLFTLEDAQRLASQSNPTLRQAEADIRAAKARAQQAGLYPNPYRLHRR